MSAATAGSVCLGEKRAFQRTGGEQRLQTVFRIVYQASTALRRINRLPVGAGGLNTTEGPEASDIE